VGSTVEPIFVTVVSAFTYADLRGDLAVGAVWSRVLERTWAVIVIDLVVNIVTDLGMQSLASADAVARILSVGVLIVGISFVFADVYAVVTEDPEPWPLLPLRALGSSMRATWQGLTFARAMLVFAVSAPLAELATTVIRFELARAGISQPDLWAQAPVVVLLLPFVQCFATFVYLDAAGYEPNHPCGE
jgi:hypothetical protein